MPCRGRASFAAAPLTLALACSAAAGCADDGSSRTATFATVFDDGGREVRVAAPPTRIISLIPAVTETVIALGAIDRLVARTAFDTDPAIADLPSTEQALIPNIEWLARFQPELVVAWADGQSRAIVARLGELGVPVYGAAIETIDDVDATIRRMGRLLGLEPRADSLAEAVRAELDAVRAAVAGRERPSVFYLVGRDPIMTAGPGTFVHEVIETAGGRNIFADARSGWPQVSLEEVVHRQPDVIVMPLGEWNAAGALERLRTAPGWRDLRAVREGRVYAVDAEAFNRPGPRVGRVARQLAGLLHPSAFPRDPLASYAAPRGTSAGSPPPSDSDSPEARP